MKNTVIMIPALNPDKKLVGYVKDLVKHGFKQVIIINDGSDSESVGVFDEIEALQKDSVDLDVVILKHAINLGKGRGLKTGINYYLNHCKDKYAKAKGLITVDSDGQHAADDVVNIDNTLAKQEGKAIVLGCRNFSLDGIPFKSRFGNKATRVIFRLCFGEDIEDTQTGLRGFTNESLPDLIELYGERFEYETNVLIECVRKNIDIIQVHIQTIYEDNNSGTHFNPITDSIKIYKLILGKFFKYIFASFSSFLIDCALFALLCRILGGLEYKIWIATIGARIISSLYNYTVNRNLVFQYRENAGKTFVQYYALCIITMLLSGLGVNFLYNIFAGYEIVLKCFVDTVLFVCNYYIQQKFIFRDKR